MKRCTGSTTSWPASWAHSSMARQTVDENSSMPDYIVEFARILVGENCRLVRGHIGGGRAFRCGAVYLRYRRAGA
jgi:hypothetical protein